MSKQLKIKLLVDARKLIETNQEHYVCLAITRAVYAADLIEFNGEQFDTLVSAGDDLKKMTNSLIGGWGTLEAQLKNDNAKMVQGWLKKGIYYHKMRNCRLRLIDDMINAVKYDEKQRQFDNLSAAKRKFHDALVDTFGPYMYPILTRINNFLKRFYK